MMLSVPAVLAGACVGLGTATVVAGWRRPTPDVRAGLDRLTGRLADRLADRLASARPDLRSSPLARALRLDRRAADLALLEQTVEALLVRKAGCALLGLLLPPLLGAIAAVAGARPGIGLPASVGLALAGLLFVVPDLTVRSRAARARQELRRTVCAFLDLVALERAADAGPVEAVDRAAAISDTPAFVRIRRALTQAQLNGVPPWHGLRHLADTTGTTELGDLADILASSGRDGTAVGTSLRARASALRTALTATETAAANTRSEYMVIPVAALGLIFMALIAYPALVRLVTGT